MSVCQSEREGERKGREEETVERKEKERKQW